MGGGAGEARITFSSDTCTTSVWDTSDLIKKKKKKMFTMQE